MTAREEKHLLQLCRDVSEDLSNLDPATVATDAHADGTVHAAPLTSGGATEHDVVVCKACGYDGSISTYQPTASVYTDIRCPRCGSTSNEHNSRYTSELLAAIRREP